MKPKIIIFQSKKELYDFLTKQIANQIKKKPTSRLGLSTGKTMLPLYDNKEFKKINFSKTTTFNQDEYLTTQKSKSFANYMKNKFLNKTNIKKENMHLLPHDSENPEKSCAEYEKAITKNKIDLQILGLGRNGHIGFNEPGSSFNSKTRVINLTKSTQKANKIKIRKALTIGIATTLKAKKIILIATGKQKAKAVKEMLEKPISTKCPASALRKHKDVLILLDKQSASLLGN